MTPTVFSCEPGWEAAALDELTRVFAAAQHERLAAGWLRSVPPSDADHPPGTPCLAFTQQVLPASQAIQAESISAWSRQIGPRLIAALHDHSGPWRLHVFHVPP